MNVRQVAEILAHVATLVKRQRATEKQIGGARPGRSDHAIGNEILAAAGLAKLSVTQGLARLRRQAQPKSRGKPAKKTSCSP